MLPGVTPQVREAIFAIAWEIGLAEECVLAPLVISEDDFECGPFSASTLARNIRREGSRRDLVGADVRDGDRSGYPPHGGHVMSGHESPKGMILTATLSLGSGERKP